MMSCHHYLLRLSIDLKLELDFSVKQFLWYTLDLKFPLVMEKSASLFIHEKDGEIGLLLENEISTLIKDSQYKDKIPVTKDFLLTTSGQCHAGEDIDGHVLCVDALSVLFQLTMLLDDDIKEHALIELCLYWSSDLENIVKEEKNDQMKEDIETLMMHYGEDKIKLLIALSKMLHHVFAMGTERNKNKIPTLCALRDVDLRSIGFRVRVVI